MDDWKWRALIGAIQSDYFLALAVIISYMQPDQVQHGERPFSTRQVSPLTFLAARRADMPINPRYDWLWDETDEEFNFNERRRLRLFHTSMKIPSLGQNLAHATGDGELAAGGDGARVFGDAMLDFVGAGKGSVHFLVIVA